MERMKRRTAIVEGPLAFRMRRSAAAHNHELGLEILTLPQLAARLVGGFSRLAEREVLFNAINAALVEDGYFELESVRRLPRHGESGCTYVRVRVECRSGRGGTLGPVAADG
jgi:hypothetical protein